MNNAVFPIVTFNFKFSPVVMLLCSVYYLEEQFVLKQLLLDYVVFMWQACFEEWKSFLWDKVSNIMNDAFWGSYFK